METFFDLRTIIVMNSFSRIILAALLIYVLKIHKTYPGFGTFTAGAVVNSLGLILLGLRHYIPVFPSVVTANTFIVLSKYMILWSVFHFCEKKHSKKTDISLLILFIIFFIYFTYYKNDVSLRIILFSLLTAYINLQITFFSVKELKTTFNTVYLPLPTSTFILMTAHLFRMGYYLFGNIYESDFMNAQIINSISVILNFGMVFLLYISFIVLNSYRAETELRKSQNDVKVLQGLLPICSHCHKIRDDKGYWEKIDHYMQKNSDIKFTHGLCPECTAKYNSEFSDTDSNQNRDNKSDKEI